MSFSLDDFLSPETLKESKRIERTVSMIAADKLHPSKDNFYSMDDERIHKMAASILMLSSPGKIGIQQNLVVRPIPDTDEYTILTGETRWRAVMNLIENGDLDTDKIPCEVQMLDDPVRDELILILTNSTQRDRSDAEKMHEIKRLRVLLEEYKKKNKLTGTIQKAIGDLLGISKTKVGTLENIDRHLSPELLKDYEEGKINTSVANKLAGLDAEAQRAGKEMLDKKGVITADDVKALDDQGDEGIPKVEERPKFKECITGLSKYGNCNCCGHDGAQCCSQCDEECNARCGWLDLAFEQKNNADPASYDMTIEVSDDPVSSDTKDDSVQFCMEISDDKEKSGASENSKENVPEAQRNDTTEQKQRYHPELINDLQEMLRLGNISADTKAFVDAAAERVLKRYRTLNDNQVFDTPDPELIEMVQGGSRVSLETFVYDFYEEIIKMFLNVVDTSEFI